MRLRCGVGDIAIADATLWRNLPYRQPDQLTLLVFTPEFALTGFGEPRQLRGRVVSADYFRTLGVPLAQGREVAREEETAGAGFVVIITDRLRRQQKSLAPA